MAIRTLITCLALLASLPAHAGSLRVVAAPTAGQTLGVVGGRPTLVSRAGKSEVLLVLQTDLVGDGVRPAFLLAVHNSGEAALEINSADISATTERGPLRVLGIAELQAIARRDVQASLFNQPPAAGDMAFQRQSERLRNVERGPDQAARGLPTTAGKVGAAPEELLAPRAPRSAMRRAEWARALAETLAMRAAFKPLRAAPGTDAGTPLPLDAPPPKSTRLEVAVSAAGERHVFVYALEEATPPQR